METRVKQVELNGLSFQYRETGDASLPPVVALHALGQSAESWDDVATVLGTKYRVLALDQRGHGGSARPGTYSFEEMRDDLFHFANVMNLEKFILMGHSMGGTVSYLFSETWPTRVERLVVEDTPPPFPDKRIEIPAEPSEALPFDWPVVPSILAQLNEPNPAWWENLGNISAPTLIIGGGSTSHVPQEKLAEVKERISQSQLVTVEGAGHNVHHANLPSFLEALKKFLNW